MCPVASFYFEHTILSAGRTAGSVSSSPSTNKKKKNLESMHYAANDTLGEEDDDRDDTDDDFVIDDEDGQELAAGSTVHTNLYREIYGEHYSNVRCDARLFRARTPKVEAKRAAKQC